LLNGAVVVVTRSKQSSGSQYWLSGFPHLVEQWDAEKNGTLSPDEVTQGSGRRVWWRCSAGPDHSWRASPNNRTNGTGCPFCANRRVSVTNNLSALHPVLAREWHPTKNGVLAPADVVATATRIAHWRCTVDASHEWKASIRDRVRDLTGCPFCAHKRVCLSNSLAHDFPDVAKEWHPTRNGALTAGEVSSGSSRVVFWRCSSCADHVWRAAVVNRVSRASGCPFCAGRSPEGTAEPPEDTRVAIPNAAA
jgi:hypothetical protein